MTLTWRQALGWRLGQHFLDPVGSAPVEDVVRRLVAVPAAGRTDLAVGARQIDPRLGEVTDARSRDDLLRARKRVAVGVVPLTG